MKQIKLFILLVVLTLSSLELSARSNKTETHIVNHQETLYTIALRYNSALDLLVNDNPNIDLLNLSAGQRIIVRKLRRRERSSNIEITLQWERMQATYQSQQMDKDIMPGDDREQEQGKKVRELQRVSRSGFKNTDLLSPLKVAMLLPLKNQHGNSSQFIDLYRGALLAINELKAQNRHITLSVYNTSRSADQVQQIIDSEELEDVDLIIGPVFEAPFKIAARYAAELKIPIVSPLATMSDISNDYVFQAPVSNGDKYESLKHLLSENNNVIVFSGTSNDTDLLSGIQSMLPDSAIMVDYNKEIEVEVLEELLADKQENVLVVLPSAELEVDEILARMSSVQSNLRVRSIKNAPISVIGSSKWLRFPNIDRTLFFKLNLNSITNYHADRGNQAVRDFDDSYLMSYGSLPSLYSYRGYDVTKMFVYALGLYGGDFVEHINNIDTTILQTPYHFEKDNLGKYINTEWVKVRYNSDFTINILN